MTNKARCPIVVTCATKKLIKEQSLTHDENGNPSESYNEIIIRGMKLLAEMKQNKIDVNRL